MMACEKCWEDAYVIALHSGRGQAEEYRRLLEERKENPCTPAQQRGGNREYSEASMLDADEWDSEFRVARKVVESR